MNTVTLQPGPITQAQISGAGVVDLVPGGAYTLSGPLTLASGQTFNGNGATIHANLPGGDQFAYAIQIAGNASNVTISNLTLVSNRGCIGSTQGSGYSGLTITGCTFTWAAGTLSDGQTWIFGIYITLPNTGTKITHNLFTNTGGATRSVYAWGSSASNFDNNLLVNVSDGIQLNQHGPGISGCWNYATGIQGKLFETAFHNANGSTFSNNVTYDYFQPYQESEGVSICTVDGNQVATSDNAITIDNNYFRLNPVNNVWGPPDPNVHRSGYGIEVGGFPATVSNNIIGGPSIPEFISCLTVGVKGSGNVLYGAGLWGNIEGEPGPYGEGSSAITGTVVNPYTAMPAPPANTFAGPAFATGATTPPVVVPPVTPPTTNSVPTQTITVSVSEITDTGALLTFPKMSGVTITAKTPADSLGTITLPNQPASATLTNLNAGWGITCIVSGTTDDGKPASGQVQFATTGHSPDGTGPKPARAIISTSTRTIRTATLDNGTVVTFSESTTQP